MSECHSSLTTAHPDVSYTVTFLSPLPHAKSAPSAEKLPKESCRTQRHPVSAHTRAANNPPAAPTTRLPPATRAPAQRPRACRRTPRARRLPWPSAPAP
eukprot:2576177-Prymnesium_polylepis.1